ncbi:GNAT family N-acetyltransferase [Deinococcus altitudinis]|uniref:GNAT family N-acetyltransferase n=1 Tax=Deinococcus altitudinis TaxID=468914 RepID=UPI003891E4E8
MNATEIRPLEATPETLDKLSELLVATVAGGGSVSFLHPLAPEAAHAFWQQALGAAARGERVVLGAWATSETRATSETPAGRLLVGTVTLHLDCPPNQPHRAEIAKMMTLPAWRGQGVASALMREAERLAAQHGRTLLVLDTASDGGAAGLYERLGFTLVGEIPDYALKPHGGLTGTLIYYKQMGAGR